MGQGSGVYLHHADVELFLIRAEAVPYRYALWPLGGQRIGWD